MARLGGAAILFAVLALAAGLGLAEGLAAGAQAPPAFEALDDRVAEFRAWLPRALAGDAPAAFRLGRAYLRGPGRREDFAEAARWYRRAAEGGHPGAQHDLAALYGKGLGVPRDYVQSYVWFDLAAAGFEHGRRRDRAIELRDMMAAFMTPAERAEAERLAQARRAGTTR